MRNGLASVKVGGRTHETRDACPATPRARQSKCLPVLNGGLQSRESMSRSPQVLVLLTSILAWIDPRTAASELLIVPDQYLTIHSAVTAASSGDSIMIRDGTYVDSLSWEG